MKRSALGISFLFTAMGLGMFSCLALMYLQAPLPSAEDAFYGRLFPPTVLSFWLFALAVGSARFGVDLLTSRQQRHQRRQQACLMEYKFLTPRFNGLPKVNR